MGALRDRLPRLLAQTRPSRRQRLLSVTVSLPRLELRSVPELSTGTVYWRRPEADEIACGRGCATELVADKANRFQRLGRGLEQLSARWLRVHPDGPPQPTRFMLAFGFDPEHPEPATPTARIHLPEVLLEQDTGPARITFSTALPQDTEPEALAERWLAEAEPLIQGLVRNEPALGQVQTLEPIAGEPARETWLDRVQAARDRIDRKVFSKVVLSRRLRVRAPSSFYAPRVINWLQQHYPSCAHIAYARPDGTLIAASPEKLVSLHDGRVRSDALASTTVRSPDPAEDEYLEQELHANPKARSEHRLVVEAIVNALRPLCRRIDWPPEPQIMKLETLQHLWTPIEGRVQAGTTLLDCVQRLHPTPAVGGFPSIPALEWLAELGERRDWFTGGIGWITAQGDGELAVVLRCAMLRDNEAEVFAGAGIVADSDPQAELGETDLKMRVLLDALARASIEP
ncbi:MAG: isochorismate synthase [Chromatiales bacterium]